MVTLLVGCGDGSTAPRDLGTGSDLGDATVRCTSDALCNDTAYCNGEERCLPLDPAADARGCVGGLPPCPDACSDATRACVTTPCVDADGDGAHDIDCGGTDCDDDDPTRYPAASEVCDVANVDEDCNASTLGFRDDDGDTYADARCCNGDACASDCDDASGGVHPGLAETCDGRDNDCDGSIDEGVVPTFYVDADRDGYGSADPAAMTMMQCLSPGLGWATSQDDCDDSEDAVHPGLPETCNGIDDNCRDGISDEMGCTCLTTALPRVCGTDVGECTAGTQRCIAGAWGPCDGSVGAGTEVCDPTRVASGGRDEDCDGLVDEGLTVSGCFTDADADGWGGGAALTRSCAGAGGACPAGTVAVGGDCNDTPGVGFSVNPGGTETCGMTVDDDCDGGFDEGMHIVRTTMPPDLCLVWQWNRTMECDGKVAEACSARAPAGTCASSSGFALAIGGAVDAVCFGPPAYQASTTIAELRGPSGHPGCDGTSIAACRAAANRLCISRGYVSGKAWLGSMGGYRLDCWDSTQAQIVYTTWAELDARDGAAEPYCAGAPTDGWFCNRAADRFCREMGPSGYQYAGFGPVEYSGSAVALVCLKQF